MASSPSRLRVPLDVAQAHRCESRKFGYRDKADSLDGAVRLMELGRVDPGCHITPYLCSLCGDWHVYNRRIIATGGR